MHECKKRVSGRLWEGALRDDTKDGCVQTNNLHKTRNTKKGRLKGDFVSSRD